MRISCSGPPKFTFTGQQKRCGRCKCCHPRQRRAPQLLNDEFQNKEKKKFTQTVTVLKGPKGINNRNAAFIFSLFFRGELGVEEMDGCSRFLFLFTDGRDVA